MGALRAHPVGRYANLGAPHAALSSLARGLKPFGIHSRVMRIGTHCAEGHDMADFNEAFARFLRSLSGLDGSFDPVLPSSTQRFFLKNVGWPRECFGKIQMAGEKPKVNQKSLEDEFATGLVTTDFQNYPSPPFRGKNWHIVYRIDRCHGINAFDGTAMVRGREVMITAESGAVAQAVLGLIHASMLLIWPDPLVANRLWRVENTKEKTSKKPGENRRLFQLSTQEIPQACLIASKASFRTRFKYALHKFLLSTQIFSVDVRSLDPSEGVHHQLSMFPDDHVRFAYSIISAYSAIEELGLEVKASKESPARLADGQWNPVVKHELESRLDLAGIDFTETVPWFLRGTPTRIEKKRQPRSLGKQKWARFSVRDCELKVVDAIADASWLRSHVSSHRFGKYITSLSVYDVANVQYLARRLILERLGFWKTSNSR